uniref:Putative methyltransferase PMT26 n=1 Tax=Rhizophora mucronata TaxID=61149 RepID=A0A2P2KPR9_RHIMU
MASRIICQIHMTKIFSNFIFLVLILLLSLQFCCCFEGFECVGYECGHSRLPRYPAYNL